MSSASPKPEWLSTPLGTVRVAGHRAVWRCDVPRKEWDRARSALLGSRPYLDLTNGSKARCLVEVGSTIYCI